MTVAKHNIPIKTSNLLAAIKQLDGRGYRVDPEHDGREVKPHAFNIVRVAETIEGRDSTDEAVTIEEIAEQFRSDDSLLEQAHELVSHVQSKEKDLAQQDADYQVRVWNWEQQIVRQEKKLESRRQSLDEEELQLRNLQFELLQLQNELIESQLATREAINGLQVSGLEADSMQTLQLEINQRFDHVMNTWRQFAADMKGIVEQFEDEAAA